MNDKKTVNLTDLAHDKKLKDLLEFPCCCRPRNLGNVTVKSENSEKSVISHFKRILTANFEKIKRPLN